MISRYEAYMNGVALSSLDPSICVLNIQPGDVQNTFKTSKIAGRVGSRVNNYEIENASVSVLFEIHEYDTIKRQSICSKVQKWARIGVLTVSDRPEQQLSVICESFPVANAKEWTEPITISFIAYNLPYWEDKIQTKVSFTAAGSKDVYVPGNAPETLVSAVLTAGGSISTITITVDGKSLVLSDLGLSSGDKVYIGYDDNWIQYIRKGTTSILNKRTGVDDLKARCGEINTFTITCSGSITAELSMRGCWY